MGISAAAMAAIASVAASAISTVGSALMAPDQESPVDMNKDAEKEAARKAKQREDQMRRLLAERGGTNLTQKTQGQALGTPNTNQTVLTAKKLGG